jgi:predicted DCC family thiol-disulfide oxidoreductase YuxK
MSAAPIPDDKLIVVYDGECPFCRSYVRLMALRKAVGRVDLIDARTADPTVRKLVELGYDLNEGMAAIYGGKIYYGSDSVVLLSSMAQEQGWLGRCIALLLREPNRARVLYPILKAGRRMTLKMMGKPLI